MSLPSASRKDGGCAAALTLGESGAQGRAPLCVCVQHLALTFAASSSPPRHASAPVMEFTAPWDQARTVRRSNLLPEPSPDLNEPPPPH